VRCRRKSNPTPFYPDAGHWSPKKTCIMTLSSKPSGPVVILLGFKERTLPTKGGYPGLTIFINQWSTKTTLQPSTLATLSSALGIKPRRQRTLPCLHRAGRNKYSSKRSENPIVLQEQLGRWDSQTWLDDIGGDMPDSTVWPPPSCLFAEYLATLEKSIAQPHAGQEDLLGGGDPLDDLRDFWWVWVSCRMARRNNMVQKYTRKVKPPD